MKKQQTMLKKFKMKLSRRKMKRKRLDAEQEDLTEKHTPTGKQPTVMLWTFYIPLISSGFAAKLIACYLLLFW